MCNRGRIHLVIAYNYKVKRRLLFEQHFAMCNALTLLSTCAHSQHRSGIRGYYDMFLVALLNKGSLYGTLH